MPAIFRVLRLLATANSLGLKSLAILSIARHVWNGGRARSGGWKSTACAPPGYGPDPLSLRTRGRRAPRRLEASVLRSSRRHGLVHHTASCPRRGGAPHLHGDRCDGAARAGTDVRRVTRYRRRHTFSRSGALRRAPGARCLSLAAVWGWCARFQARPGGSSSMAERRAVGGASCGDAIEGRARARAERAGRSALVNVRLRTRFGAASLTAADRDRVRLYDDRSRRSA